MFLIFIMWCFFFGLVYIKWSKISNICFVYFWEAASNKFYSTANEESVRGYNFQLQYSPFRTKKWTMLFVNLCLFVWFDS